MDVIVDHSDHKSPHEIKVEDRLYNDSWRSCCGIDIDRRSTIFFTQMTVIVGTMAFCIFKLTKGDTCEIQSPYLALLTTLIGVVTPSPIISSKS
jgi:hypothetical protein